MTILIVIGALLYLLSVIYNFNALIKRWNIDPLDELSMGNPLPAFIALGGLISLIGIEANCYFQKLEQKHQEAEELEELKRQLEMKRMKEAIREMG